MQEIKFILLGLGTVAKGFLEILIQKQDWLQQEKGLVLKLVGFANTSARLRNNAGFDIKTLSNYLNTAKDEKDTLQNRFKNDPEFEKSDKSIEALLNTTAADVVFEATPTNMHSKTPAEPVIDYLRMALKTKKSVITANKAPLVFFYDELLALARQHGAHLMYESTVLSGTPVFSLLSNCLRGIKVSAFEGILNGTTNFIISEMEQGNSYQEALRMAQNLGYAEADPSYDVEGLDSVAKLLILSRDYCKTALKKENVPFEGITRLTQEKVKKAIQSGFCYRLVSSLRFGCYQVPNAKVELEKIPLSHPFASIQGSQNALLVHCEFLEDITIIGPGAGKLATACGFFNDFLSWIETCKV